jgi:hypothetical protein
MAVGQAFVCEPFDNVGAERSQATIDLRDRNVGFLAPPASYPVGEISQPSAEWGVACARA